MFLKIPLLLSVVVNARLRGKGALEERHSGEISHYPPPPPPVIKHAEFVTALWTLWGPGENTQLIRLQILLPPAFTHCLALVKITIRTACSRVIPLALVALLHGPS